MNDVATTTEPLWLAIEGKILELNPTDLDAANQEQAIHRVAEELDSSGYNVSRHGGNMLQLRTAVEARLAVGKPLLKDFNDAVAALTLEDVTNARKAAATLAVRLGETWPRLREHARSSDILEIVDKTKLDLLVAKAGSLPDDQGIRLLIAEEVASETIKEALSITEDQLAAVHAAIEAELAAIARVGELLQAVEGQSDEDRAKHLITNDVSDELILEHAGIDQAVVDGAREALAEALKEKQRQEEEAAALKAAEAEGPSLDDIAPDDLVEFIESIEEILEFSDQEDEIRQMCEQSSIPKSLVDIAVSDPAKLEALKEAAEG